MACHLGWGLLSQFPPFRYFPKFSALSKHTLTVEYRVYIWHVSPQLSCGDTCQIWMWFEESNMYFREIENFAYGEVNERSFSNPHPSTKPLLGTNGHILLIWSLGTKFSEIMIEIHILSLKKIHLKMLWSPFCLACNLLTCSWCIVNGGSVLTYTNLL